MTTVRGSEKAGLAVLCRLLGRTRQAYYNQFRESERAALRGDLAVQEVMRIRKKQKRLGVRKLYFLMADFFNRHGMGMGRDAFFDLLRESGMLVRRRKARKPRTTFSCPWMKRYPNLAREFVPFAPNQLWVSDITYIRIGMGFGYLSLVTDAYSRKIVGFHLGEDLRSKGCVAALRMAMRNNRQREGLIHHSDRGIQYYSRRYIRMLGDIRISMSEKSDPIENAIAERVNGILKQELLEERFDSFSEARRKVAEAVSIYNNLRPHSSIDMLTPAEAHTQTGELKRRWKHYYSNKLAAMSQASA